MANVHFVHEPPPQVLSRLEARGVLDEDIQIQLSADMANEQQFGERWIVVTDRRILFISPTDGETGDGNGTVEVDLEEVAEATVEELVGAGRLEVSRKLGPPVSISFSNSLAPIFGEVAQGISQLAKGVEEMSLPTEMVRTRCATCNRLLPEKDGICPFCIRKWDTIMRMARLLEPYKWRVIGLMAISLVIAGLQLLPPLFVRHIIDDVLTDDALTPKAGVDKLLLFVGGLVAVRLGFWVFKMADGFLRSDLSAWTGRDLRARLYEQLQFLPLRFYERRQVGNLMSRFMNDSDRLEMFILFGLPFILNNALMFIGILCLLFYMSWKLTLYVLVPIPFIVIASVKKWDSMRRLWNRYHAKWSRFTTHLNESISGIRVVKSFAQEDREERRFLERNDDLRGILVTAERAWFVFYAILSFVMSFGIFFVWYFGGRQILANELTLGALMAFVSYIWQLYGPIQFFSNLSNMLTRSFAGAERIFEVIDATPESFDDPDAKEMPHLEGRFSFEDVKFGYDPGKPVLKGVDLEVEPGEMIGLVGKSGVGKSTLINLVCRFYDVDGGMLKIDGEDITSIKLRDLRSQIGMVAQESFLFNGSIADNIGYGKPSASFEEIMRAATAANAHEFIVAKPDGYDTVVGERGDKLSGGEKQRIAIARAILHNPKVLILDEATSSVDTPTEKKLQEAIKRLVAGRTTFAIAHRLSTLRSADRLVVLDEGKVAEVGTHSELMEREGIFYNLVKTQQETTSVMAVGGGKDDPSAQ